MPDRENPAGRLHELLRLYARDPNTSMLSAWATALEVDESEVPYYLGELGSLLRDVRRAASETGSPAFDPMPGHLTDLSRCIFPSDNGLSAAVRHSMPNGNAMQLLAALSYALKLGGSEGTIPDEDDLNRLKVSVQDLIQEVLGSQLPPEVQRDLLHRLAELLEALENVHVVGPEGVRRAAEALAVTAVIHTPPDGDDRGTVQQIVSVARRTWCAFSVATVIAASLVTWNQLAEMTGLIDSAPEVRLIGPGPSTQDTPGPQDPPGPAQEPREH